MQRGAGGEISIDFSRSGNWFSEIARREIYRLLKKSFYRISRGVMLSEAKHLLFCPTNASTAFAGARKTKADSSLAPNRRELRMTRTRVFQQLAKGG
jgi:hypothetical protein